ncbi:hypothetical protein FRUB_02251 [Fimbriiglobus ruber]|uniref:Uncharacterized protein n=1 Tax=Fimbriiglobus ruber TaxID=1908690 RepID=A0A225E4A5_9BACT|nr:hypothetical protein FRUB_02251 [Fimbriiglobus ruber]
MTLNRERYADEVKEGLHAKKKPTAAKRGNQATTEQSELFGGRES